MKLRSAIAVLAAAGLTLTACSSGSDTTTETSSAPAPAADATGTLTVWLMDNSQPQSVVDAVNAKFAKEYPNVDVEVELQQWSGIQDKLTSSLGRDSTPDVVEIGNRLTATLADAGLLADLSSNAGDFKVDGMLPGLKPPGELDGVRYGIPYYGGVRVVVYNKNHFKDADVEVPTSLKKLNQAAKALQKANSDNDDYSAFYFPGEDWDGAVPFVWDAGGEIAEQQDGTWIGDLDQPEAVAGLTTLKNLVQRYSKAPIDSDDSKNVQAFQTGNVGMMIGDYWVPGVLNRGDLAGDVGVFALPGSAAGSTSPVFFGGSDLAVSAKSSQQALAVTWMQILTGLNMQTKLAEEGGVIPNQEGAFVGHKGNPFLLVADEAATNSRFTPVSPNWPSVESSRVLPEMLVKIFSDSLTVEEATAEASQQVANLLNG